MNRIDELIAQHCPNGVEFLHLGELLDYSQPGKYLVKSTAYDASFDTPVLTAGQTFILGYTDEVEGIYRASSDEPVIIFDDFTTAFKWVDFDFKPKSSAMKMLIPKPGVNLRYVWFAMQTIRYSPQDHARQWIGTYSQFRIPVPPLEVQRAIVEVLDTFSKLEAELEAELEARKQQYEHYQIQVFETLSVEDAQLVPLKDLGEWYGGGTPSKSRADFWTNGKIPWVSPKDMGGSSISTTEDYITPEAIAGSSTKLVPEGSVALVVRSSILEHTLPVAHVPIPVTLNQDMKAVVPKPGISDRYVFHALRASRNELLRTVKRTGGSVASLDSKKLWKFEIPVPSPAKQEEVSDLFDKFDSLVNDLSVGLPAELAARRQQYEYYRDKLLTFKELEVAA